MLAVVGGGPAGLAAVLLAARHGRSTIVLDPLGAGGALLNQERIEGFPGLPEAVPGYELGPRLQEQAMEAGAALELGEVTRIESRNGDWALLTDSRELVVVAVWGEGAPALVEGLELVRHDVRVVLMSPEHALGGQDTYRRRIAETGQIEVRNGTVIEEILGDEQVDGVRVCDLASGESATVPVEGVFAYAGRVPNTRLLEGLVVLDDDGFVPADGWMQTELPGLFAAGDMRAGAVGQAIAAAGDGATAAVAAHRYLADRAP